MAKYTFLSSNDATLTGIYSWAKKLITDLNNPRSQSSEVIQSGSVTAWLSDEIPDGWLLCDGGSYTIDQQRSLFVAIGYTYGGADANFNVPDFRNRILMGAGSSVSLNETAGADEVTLTVNELPSHNHDVDDPGHKHDFTAEPHTHEVTDPGHHHAGGVSNTGTASAVGTTGPTTPADTEDAFTDITLEDAIVSGTTEEAKTDVKIKNTGEGKAFSVLNPVIGVNYIIKA